MTITPRAWKVIRGLRARVAGRAARVLAAACAVAMALAGCGGRDVPVAEAGFPPARTDGVRVGWRETADRNASIGLVLAARFTESGERVVILDFAPPYVKVFRRDGSLERAFLSEGPGPMEMRHPAALAVAGDSAILVADGTRRVAVFGMDGQLRGEGRTGFPVLAAAAGCDGEWIAYGPTFRAGNTPAWLHRLRISRGPAQTVDLEFRDVLGDRMIGSGRAYGIARSGDTVHVWHVLTETPAVLGWDCGQTRPDAWALKALDQRGESPRRQGEAVRMTIEPGSRSLSGMAAVPGGVVLAAQVVPAPGESATTELTLVTPAGERTISVPGDYTLRDSHPRHGVLVSTTDPTPRLFTISTDDLRRLFGPRE